jgi:hypothetical protein
VTAATDLSVQAPFLGLRYFDEEQSHLFFGREQQVCDILEKLNRSRLVTVIGSSGSGKSSLVRAGVIPSLKAGFLGSPRWRIVKMRPGNRAIANLARELEKSLGAGGLEVTLGRGPLGLVQAIGESRLPAGEHVLIIVDQFEELFRYQRESGDAEAARGVAAAFVKLLLEATTQRDLPIYVVITMRSDYLGDCAQFRDLPERINEGLYLVPRMRRDQLQQAIVGPVAVEDAVIAPRLVQRLLNDTSDDPDQLPVLQHVLFRAWIIWNHAPRPLDLEDLDAVGGMRESLSRHADEIYDSLSLEQQNIARIVFQQLSDRDADGREIRRPAPLTHIAAVAGVPGAILEEVVARFAVPEAALLYRNEDGHLDITHESLIRKWRLIQGDKTLGSERTGWLQEEIDARDQFLVLLERARKNDTLAGGALEGALRWRALGLNKEWAARHVKEQAPEAALRKVMNFIEHSRAEALRNRRLRVGLVVTAAVTAALMLVIILLLWRSTVQARIDTLEELVLQRNEELAGLASRYFVLRGQVLRLAKPVPEARVLVSRDDLQNPTTCDRPSCTSAITDAEGRFTLDLTNVRAIQGDNLVLTVERSGYQRYSRKITVMVSVTDASSTPVEVRLLQP